MNLKNKLHRASFLIISCFIILIGIFSSAFPVSAYTARTQQEALDWARDQVGRGIDVDNAYGNQCVDYIAAYYEYLGVPRTLGNGGDYSHNALPDGWQRIEGAQPQPGDILVYTGGYGHVAIYESDYCTYHQNFSNVPYVQKISYHYDCLSNPYWGVIRPDFNTAPADYLDLGQSFNASVISYCGKPIVAEGHELDSNVAIRSVKNTAQEGWHFERQADGSYIITSLYTDQALDVTGAGTESGTNVKVSTQSGEDNSAQKWYICGNQGGYRLVSKLSNDLSLEVYRNGSSDGTNIAVSSNNDTAAQMFSITKFDDALPSGLSGSDLCINQGKSVAIHYDFTPDNVSDSMKGVTWISNDPSIASVDSNGVVTGLKCGTTEITAISSYNEQIRATVRVQVRPVSAWMHNASGWWYQHADGTYTTHDFEEINGQTYYFDAHGYMLTGWQWLDGSWYYFNSSGHMMTGWQRIGSSWYYFNGSGHMMTGWQWIDGSCYYFYGSGVMAKGTWIDGNYVNGSGIWVA